LIISEWSKVSIKSDDQIEKDKKLIMDIIREIRSLRADNNIMPNKTIGLQIYAKNKNAEVISEVIEVIAGIVKADSFELVESKPSDVNLAY
jgi:valyl-tRNA synthetase